MKPFQGQRFDAAVVGGGHAGIEAGYILAKLGLETAFVTQEKKAIGRMPCNPSIGGVAKGHLVREIDALGGIMAKTSDNTGIHFKVLNASKGDAVQGLRCQSDRILYAKEMQRILEGMKSLQVIEGEAAEIEVKSGKVTGLFLESGKFIRTNNVILATGTFLSGKMFIGFEETKGGRVKESPSDLLAADLRKKGLELKKLKTGTPARLLKSSIDFKALERQDGDEFPEPFSLFSSPFPALPQVACHITYTTAKTAEIVKSYLKESPLFEGLIKGVGPRYCPSLEDKIVKFPHHERHQVFLEPDGIESEEIYPNGISTSLPRIAQDKFIRSVPGLEAAEVITYGYAVEYDYLPPTRLDFNLCHKGVDGLYFAGQVIGTTGYEEAAGLGLYAAYNIAAKIFKKPPFRLERDESYLGVMVSDLVTNGVLEPYRLFTSRAEYRMLLDRHTAYRRLSGHAEKMGLISEEEKEFRKNREELFLNSLTALKKTKFAGKGANLHTLLKRSDADSVGIMNEIGLKERLMKKYLLSEVKNQGYRERQKEEAGKLISSLNVRIPDNLDMKRIPGLSREIVERLTTLKPETLLQAGRIPGITPSALTILKIEIEKRRRNGH